MSRHYFAPGTVECHRPARHAHHLVRWLAITAAAMTAAALAVRFAL